MTAKWLDALNPPQREAVEHIDGPLLVLSGAGTGKTRVLTCRLANLIFTGAAQPWNILAVTFTNKAAREMRERVADLIGADVEKVWFGTFHALAARILRRHAEIVGLTPNFTILDADDQLRLVKQILIANNMDVKRFPPRMVLAIIERWKDKGLMPDKVSSGEAGHLLGGRALDLYQQYQQRLLALNACDFGDLLLHNLTIFMGHADILASYQTRITHIMVDEYQDSNVAQYLWIRLLAQKSHNLCCVGDDDQSIYGWRGAEVENMLRFGEIYPDAKTIRLEENYRSTGHILGAASGLIAHNHSRLGKTLYTADAQGEKIHVCGFWDGMREAQGVAAEILALTQQGGHSLSEIAVLVRAGSQTREFEEAFIREKIPYRVVGAKFYERLEIRDAVAYLRLLAQSADDLAFERIINTPARGLGAKTIEQIRRVAREAKLSMFAGAQKILADGGLKPAAHKHLAAFIDMVLGWQKQLDTLHHTELLELVLEESGYMAMWQNEKTPDAEGRVENLNELITALGTFPDLRAFLDHIALVMDGDTASPGGEVMLMTLHAAKGLEFDVVFLPCWEEGAFPSPRTLDEKGMAGLEEERRLAYVGITRARQKLYISYAASRRVHGLWQNGAVSRFIGELPPEHIIEESDQGMRGMRRPVNEAGSYSKNDYRIGDRIFHQKFGNGNVIAVDGDNLEVDFDKAGEKTLKASFVKKVPKL